MFDEPAPTFGRFRVTAALGDGRFGPVHLGIDPETDQVVVIRTFSDRLTTDEQHRLVDALQELCEQPLDHASIATPIACGLEQGVPYLTHSYLPGTSVDEYLRAHGPRPLAEVVVRVTHLAAAIDFAAAAGVHHGTMSPRDIIFAPQSTGVSGFGLAQAMRQAGASVNEPTGADDVYALAAMTFELLVGYRFAGGNVRDALAPLRGAPGVDYDRLVAALEPTLAGEPSVWPATALAFAASLHAAQTDSGTVAPASRPVGRDVGRLSFGAEEPQVAGPEPVAAPVPDYAEALPAAAAAASHYDETAEPFIAEAPEPVWDAPTPASFDAPLHAVAEEPVFAERLSEPLALHPPAVSRAAASAPVFGSAVNDANTGSGWRVVAIGAAVAAVLLIAAAVWMFGGSGGRASSPASSAAGASANPPTERVEDRQPVAATDAGVAKAPASPASPTPTPPPSSAASSAPAAVAAGPEPPPVVHEPPAPPREPQPSARETARGAAERARAERAAADRRAEQAAADRRAEQAAADRRAKQAATERRTPATTTRAAAPPAAARTERTEPAAGTGRILVRSTPAGATVVVDGVPRGETPAAIRELAFGSHVVVVTAVGYPQWQQTITLSEDRPAQSFEVALDSASSAAAPAGSGLQIDSRPTGAQVFVDGSPVGVTPIVLPAIAAGAHAVRIELAGYRPWSTSVSVTSGQRTRVAASLEQ